MCGPINADLTVMDEHVMTQDEPSTKPGEDRREADQADGSDQAAPGTEDAARRAMVHLERVVLDLCRRSPEAAGAIEAIGQWLAAVAGSVVGRDERTTPERVASPDTSASSPSTPPSSPPQPTTPITPPPLPRGPANVVELKIGDAEATRLAVPGSAEEADAARTAAREAERVLERAPRQFEQDLPDLELVSRRCRLMAEACHWSIRRRRLLRENSLRDPEVSSKDEDIRTRAKAMTRYQLWMMDGSVALPDDAVMERFAANYTNLADAAEYVDRIWKAGNEDSEERDQAYGLLAEAQSALRVALDNDVDIRNELDQFTAFSWLKVRTREDNVYIERYMRLQDPADPEDWEDLSERLSERMRAYERTRQSHKQRSDLLNKAKYHGRKLAEDRSTDPDDDWTKLIDSLDQLMEMGLRPSNTDVREIILPVMDSIPESMELPDPVAEILREADRYLATREQQSPQTTQAPVERTEEMARAVDLVRDRVLVLVGGEFRPQSKARLERDLELRELCWVDLKPHESLGKVESAITREDVHVVLLMKRLCSHMHEDVAKLCKKHGKAYVRLPSGYGSNQIAKQILKQASDQLGLSPDGS